MATPLTSAQRLLAIGLILGVSLVAFEVTAVITALPTITDELGGDSLYGVSLAAYTLATLVALVAAGELADRRGPSLPFLLSVAMLVAGLLVAAAAGSMVWVVVGRIMQGAGSGGFPPIAYVLVKRAFPEDRQPGMYAFLGAGWVLPSLFAPAISGWITESFGWRWVFLGIVPLAVAVGALAVRPMRQYGPQLDPEHPLPPSRVPRALTAALGVGAVVTGLQADRMLVGLVVALAGGVVAARALRRLLPGGVLRARIGFPAIVTCRLLATATFLGVDSFVPLAADRIHGVGPFAQGMVIVGAALSWTVGQWWRARRPHGSPSANVRVGFAVMLLGVLLTIPVLWAGWPLPATFVAWSVGGLGMGLLFNPTTVSAMSYAEEGREGAVSSQVNLADSLGFSLMGGIGGATIALADRSDAVSLPAALGANFVIAAVLACVGIVAAGNIRRRPA